MTGGKLDHSVRWRVRHIHRTRTRVSWPEIHQPSANEVKRHALRINIGLVEVVFIERVSNFCCR